jgi:class 3 adenylate cyclase
MPQEGFQRKLTAFIAADVEGCNRLMSEDGEAAVRMITTQLEDLTTLIEPHSGNVVHSPGDNLEKMACIFPLTYPT